MKNNHLPDSPFFRFMDVVGDVFLLNLCWLAGCLPVVTAGASTTAAFSVAGKMAAGQEYRVFHDYGTAFRRDFALSTRTWLVMVVLGLLLWFDYQLGLAKSGSLGGILIASASAFGVIWLAALGGGFALLGRFAYRRGRDAMKDGLRLCLARPQAALVWLVFMGTLPVLYGSTPQLFWYLFPLWLLIGGGTAIVLTARLLRPSFVKIEEGQH